MYSGMLHLNNRSVELKMKCSHVVNMVDSSQCSVDIMSSRQCTQFFSLIQERVMRINSVETEYHTCLSK